MAVLAVAVVVVATARSSTARASAMAPTWYRLVQYPAAGFGGFDRQIDAARRSIDMEMYELSDPAAEADLDAAAARGVRVRVLLDRAYSGATVNAPAMRQLRAHGVQARWAPEGYIFHIKATTFDGTTSDISTANLTSEYFADTRDAEVIDTDPVQVRAIEATFDRDFAAAPGGDPADQTVQAPGLIWSPDTGAGTAQTALAGEIARARTAVDFESEELSDTAVIDALAADARRHVACRIVMTDSSDWDAAFTTLRRAGCAVHVFPDSASALYIHEKLILDDPGRTGESMVLGSQNASVSSLTANRELGIRLTAAHGGAAAIASSSATFAADFAHASPWTPPATTKPKPTPTPTPTPAACHPRSAAGNCYEPGEYCSDADHGLTGVAGDGAPIVCEDDDGWRWERR